MYYQQFTTYNQDDPLEFILCVNYALILLTRRYQKKTKPSDYNEQEETQELGKMICYKLLQNITESHDIGIAVRGLFNFVDVLHGTIPRLNRDIRNQEQVQKALSLYVDYKQGFFHSFFETYHKLSEDAQCILKMNGRDEITQSHDKAL